MTFKPKYTNIPTKKVEIKVLKVAKAKIGFF